MNVPSVKTTEYKARQAQNIKEAVTAGAMGALAGYGLKYALPISQHEHDVYISGAVSQGIKSQIEGARANELKVIREEMTNDPKKYLEEVGDFLTGNKRFLILGQKDVVDKAAESLDNGRVKAQVQEVLGRINGLGDEAALIANKSAKAVTKVFRPALMYMAVGATVAVSIVTLKNSLDRLQDKYVEDIAEKKFSKMA